MEINEKFPGVFLIDGKLATRNSVPGNRVYGEGLMKIKGTEYRLWNPERSKLSAAIVKGIKNIPIKAGDNILYLGCAHGTTASHIADIIGNQGIVYGIEFSGRCFKELLPLCKKYRNIVPLLTDARFPEKYPVFEKVNIVYCDIAQRDATDIAIRNCREYLKPNGCLLLVIKARSIDVVESPKKIVQQEIEKLKDFEVLDWKMLDPFEEGHGFVIAKIK